MAHVGLPTGREMNAFDKHVRTLLIAYPLVLGSRLEVMRQMLMSQAGGGFSWSPEGILVDGTDLSVEAEETYREKFFEDVDLREDNSSRQFSSMFEGGETHYKLLRAKRKFKLINIDAIACASPPSFSIGISAERVLGTYHRKYWNCLNIPEHADPLYRKAALEVVVRVLGTLKDHPDTEAYAEIEEVLRQQAKEPTKPKI